MKAPKILLAGLLAISTVGVAQAQTTVYLTGSTAFRTATQNAILDMLSPGYSVGFVGSSYAGAGAAIISGTTKSNSIPVTFKTYWSGSLAGIQTVSEQMPIANSFLSSTNSTSGGTNTAIASPGYDASDIPTATMADSSQDTTQYPTPTLSAQTVGVVDFTFVKNKTAPAGLTNMTPLLAQALWSAGSLPLSMWTGDTNDATNLIYAIGRNPDSGTRNTAFLETGIQSYVSSLTPAVVVQYAPTNATGRVTAKNTGNITSQGVWPPETIDNIAFPLGDSGYSSGGDLATAMGQTSSFNYVTYLGLSDASTALGLGATEIAYTGTYFSHGAVENGPYTFWSYEQLDYLPTYATTDANGYTVANLLAQTIANENLSGVGESLTSMNVSRAEDGQPVTP